MWIEHTSAHNRILTSMKTKGYSTTMQTPQTLCEIPNKSAKELAMMIFHWIHFCCGFVYPIQCKTKHCIIVVRVTEQQAKNKRIKKIRCLTSLNTVRAHTRSTSVEEKRKDTCWFARTMLCQHSIAQHMLCLVMRGSYSVTLFTPYASFSFRFDLIFMHSYH